MTLFTLLLVLALERLFKYSEHWQLDHWLELLFSRLRDTSLAQSLLLTICWMLLVAICLRLISGWLYDIPLLLMWITLLLLCIGAGNIRRQYRNYLVAATRGDNNAATAISEELILIYSLPMDCDPLDRLRKLQNVLLWINFRFYLAPLFWLVIVGPWGPVALAGYAFLRAWQTWLIRRSTPIKHARSGIDILLHWLDWIPVRLACIAYILLGNSEKTPLFWFTSLRDIHRSQYSVLTQLAQTLLVEHEQSYLDAVQTPRSAVSLAKRTTIVIVLLIILLNINCMLI